METGALTVLKAFLLVRFESRIGFLRLLPALLALPLPFELITLTVPCGECLLLQVLLQIRAVNWGT